MLKHLRREVTCIFLPNGAYETCLLQYQTPSINVSADPRTIIAATFIAFGTWVTLATCPSPKPQSWRLI